MILNFGGKNMQKKSRIIALFLLCFVCLSVCFAVSASAENERVTGNVSMNWSGGFVHATNDQKRPTNENAAFHLSDPITVTKAGTTVKVWLVGNYSSASICYVSVWTKENFNGTETADGYKTLTFVEDDKIMSAQSSDYYAERNFSMTSETRTVNGTSVSGHLLTYTTRKDGEILRFTGYKDTATTALMNELSPTATYTLPAGETARSAPVYAGVTAPSAEELMYLGIDRTAENTLSDTQKSALSGALTSYYTKNGDLTQTVYDTFAKTAGAMDYAGLQARVTGNNPGIRSLYIVSESTISEIADRNRVTYGALMGLGLYNNVDFRYLSDLTVSYSEERNTYVADTGNTSAVVVYDSDGGTASNRYVGYDENGNLKFAYTTMYSDGYMNYESYTELGLVYRGFLVLNYDGEDYFFYYDAVGELFGDESSTYGRSATVSDLYHYFATEKDEAGNYKYKTSPLFVNVLRNSTKNVFTITAAENVPGVTLTDGVTYIAADAEKGTLDTWLITIGNNGAYIEFTVENAREGFYNLGFVGNTLGSTVQTLLLQNVTSGGAFSGYQSEARPYNPYNNVTKAARTAAQKQYTDNFASYFTDKGYTETTLAALRSNTDAYRVLEAYGETFTDETSVYLYEGTNTLRLWCAFQNQSDYATALGIRSITLTIADKDTAYEAAADTDNHTTITARDAKAWIGDDKVTDGQNLAADLTGATTMATIGNQTGLMIRKSGYAQSSPNSVYYSFTVPKNGTYRLGTLYSADGAGLVTVYKGTVANGLTEVGSMATTAYGKGPSTGVSYKYLGQISLKAGTQYTVRFRADNTTNYINFMAFDFSLVPETETKSSFTYGTGEITYDNASNVTVNSDGTLTLNKSSGVTLTLNVPAEISGFYRVSLHGKTAGENRIGSITLKNNSLAAADAVTTYGRIVKNTDDATGALRDITIGYQYLDAKKGQNTLTLTFAQQEDALTFDSVTVTLCSSSLENENSAESLYFGINGTKTGSYTGTGSAPTPGGAGLVITSNSSQNGTYTFNDKLTLERGGTYRLVALMEHCNSNDFDNIGFSLTGEKEGNTTAFVKSLTDTGLSAVEMQVGGSSTAVVYMDFGTLTLDADTYTLKAMKETGGVTQFAAVMLVRTSATVTVQYRDQNGNPLADAPDYSAVFAPGEEYAITSPTVYGYKADTAVVTGVGDDNGRVVTVTYTPVNMQVKIDYILPDGTEAAPSYIGAHLFGMPYSIVSPTVPGYRPVVETVSGTLNGPVSIKVRYVARDYTLTVRYLTIEGTSVRDSISVTDLHYGDSYYYDSPACPDGYAYCTLPVVAGNIVDDVDITVYYAKEKDHVVTADDMTAVGSAEILPADTAAGTAATAYLPSNGYAATSHYVSMTVRAAVSGVYKVDFICNQNNGRIHYFFLENVTTGGARSNTRLGASANLSETPDKTAYAVTNETVAGGVNNEKSFYVYLKQGDNTLRAYVNGVTDPIGIERFVYTLTDDMTYGTEKISTVESTIAKLNDNLLAYSPANDGTKPEIEGMSSGVLLRWASGKNDPYAVWTVDIKESGYYRLSGFMAISSAADILWFEDLDATLSSAKENGAVSFTAAGKTLNGGSSAAAVYQDNLGELYLEKGTHYLRVRVTGSGWANMHRVFLKKVNYHTLTVNYVYEDGTTAAPSSVQNYLQGENYSVSSPAIAGYRPSSTTVAGTMGYVNETVTVTYTEHNVTLTFRAVDKDGNFIQEIARKTIPASSAYHYDELPLVPGYLYKDGMTSYSGSSGEEDETVDLTVLKTTFGFDAAAIASAAGKTASDATESTLPTVELDTTGFTLTVNAEVRGVYKITARLNTAGGYIGSIQTTNAKNGLVANGRVTGDKNAANKPSDFSVSVPSDTAETVLAYQYLEVGENRITFAISDITFGSFGAADITFSVETPEFGDKNVYIKAQDTKDFVFDNTQSNKSNKFYGGTVILRPYSTDYATYTVTVPENGEYDIYALTAMDGGVMNIEIIDASGNREKVIASYGQEGSIGSSFACVETKLNEGVKLYKGTYTVKVYAATNYVSYNAIRFVYRNEIDTTKGDNGVYEFLQNGKTVKIDTNFYPGMTRKAITFSYDDGNENYDPYLLRLMNQYGYKGSFMIPNGRSADFVIKYSGHEVANHSYTHSGRYQTTNQNPYTLSEILADIKTQKDNLESAIRAAKAADPTLDLNDVVASFAVPMTSGYFFEKEGLDRTDNAEVSALFIAAGATDYTEAVVQTMTNEEVMEAYFGVIGITNSRYIKTADYNTGNGYGYRLNNRYTLPEDFMMWIPTAHHSQLKDTDTAADGYQNSLAEEFRDLADDGALKLFYIWGHPTEVDSSGIEDGREPGTTTTSAWIKYEALESFMQMFVGDDYYKDTLSGITAYVNAQRGITVDADGTVYNTSDVDLYVRVTSNGVSSDVVIPAHGSYRYSTDTATLSASDLGAAGDTLTIAKNTAVTANFLDMKSGAYAIYAKFTSVNNTDSAVDFSFVNTSAAAIANMATGMTGAWNSYTTVGRVAKGATLSADAYTLIGYQYMTAGANTVTLKPNGDCALTSVKAERVQDIDFTDNNTISLLAGPKWLAADESYSCAFTVPEAGEYTVYFMASCNASFRATVTDADSWNMTTSVGGTWQVGGASQSGVAITGSKTLMLQGGDATLNVYAGSGYLKLYAVVLVKSGAYAEPESRYKTENNSDTVNDDGSRTITADVTLTSKNLYGVALAAIDENGTILGYDTFIKGTASTIANGSLAVTLSAEKAASFRAYRIFAIGENDPATMENPDAASEADNAALQEKMKKGFRYDTVNGVRILVISDQHYATGATTRTGVLTGNTYTTTIVNSYSKGGQHNNYGYDSESHIQAMIDAIKDEYKRGKIDAVMMLGDMTDMDFWYSRVKADPTAYLTDTNGDGTVDFNDFYKSAYDELYYTKTEYYDQLKNFTYTVDGVEKTASVPVFFTLGNHDVYNEEWFFDLYRPDENVTIGTEYALNDKVSVYYASYSDYVVLFKNDSGEKDVAFMLPAQFKMWDGYTSGQLKVVTLTGKEEESKENFDELLTVAKGYRQVYLGGHIMTSLYTDFIGEHPEIAGVYVGDAHTETDYTYSGLPAYIEGHFVHSFNTVYGFAYNFAAEPWGYMMIENYGNVSKTYRVHVAADYDTETDIFFRYADAAIRGTTDTAQGRTDGKYAGMTKEEYSRAMFAETIAAMGDFAPGELYTADDGHVHYRVTYQRYILGVDENGNPVLLKDTYTTISTSEIIAD